MYNYILTHLFWLYFSIRMFFYFNEEFNVFRFLQGEKIEISSDASLLIFIIVEYIFYFTITSIILIIPKLLPKLLSKKEIFLDKEFCMTVWKINEGYVCFVHFFIILFLIVFKIDIAFILLILIAYPFTKCIYKLFVDSVIDWQNSFDSKKLMLKGTKKNIILFGVGILLFEFILN